ncbi:gamma-glutamylcyclotransferase [Paraflavitalea soli]|uniref:Gamma-glutamylcyclotransferase n=1 Tax=Paraflavitalea soli TaxID=2315862 RepID=A0A3B7MP32_9BACT|nr:gamma-glutamylcyclotransferase family protein [Paraflavitalea soli]AXY76274.1 gamma-glutamylcyclotransferase [Paraflavitalea soli]
MATEIYQLFVYGSLLSGFHHPAYGYISRYFTLIGPAKVKGKLFDMGEYPAAVPVNEDTWIMGELYQLNNKDEFEYAICQLDDYEGIFPEAGGTPLYRREPVNVVINEKDTLAWIYWYNQDVLGKPLIASGSVLEYRDQQEKKNQSGFF